MKKLFYVVLVVVLLSGGFVAGSWYSRKGAVQHGADTRRKILYYVDPMNPSHTSISRAVRPAAWIWSRFMQMRRRVKIFLQCLQEP